ncbi:hypothetical protein [Chryseobacterium daeguense]|uniref:hypothetical protein n=1 Tax=Chryseobacterium daeguense TaxID=412438 RepID=UPI000419266A|nr:hypothetical protein [Chryseobacterium daeguense]
MENLLENRDLINRYLELSVKQQFNFDVNLKDEYTFTQNLVSGKPIIATTFSEQMISHPKIKLFLTSMIAEINNGHCTAEFMQYQINNLQEPSSGQMEEII